MSPKCPSASGEGSDSDLQLEGVRETTFTWSAGQPGKVSAVICVSAQTLLATFSSHWRFLGFHRCDQGWDVHLFHSYSVPTESFRWCCPLPRGWGPACWCHLCHQHHQGGKNVAVGLTESLVWGTLSVICSAWFHPKSAGRKWRTKRKYLAMNPSNFSFSAFLTHLHFVALMTRAEEKRKQFKSKAIFDNVNAQLFILPRFQICNFKMELGQSLFYLVKLIARKS